MPKLNLSFLGTFEVRLDGEPIKEFESSKVRALLIYLVMEADKPHSRDQLAGMFWGESNDETANKNLRQALSNLRKAIRNEEFGQPLLNITPAAVQASSNSNLWVDTAEFKRLLVSCETHPHRTLETCTVCASRLKNAMSLYRGSFLEGFFLKESDAFQDWIAIHREQFFRQAADALRMLIVYHQRRGEIKPAIAHAQQLVALDPWYEEAHVLLMKLYARDNQRSAALKQYETCRSMLKKEMGVEPQPETVLLYKNIRENTPPHIELNKVPNNLPAEPTSFIGRARELDQLADYLQRIDAHLVTLTGPGGAGKSRLALQAARGQLFSFSHGVFYISLGSLADYGVLPHAIAEAIGFIFASGSTPQTQLLNYLREKEMLLVLDNFEQIIGSADFVAEVVKTCPKLTLLVTSREPLRLQAEWLFSIGGLDNFSENQPNLAPEISDSLRLFEARASQAQHDFALISENIPHAQTLCRILDGLPLGIELAAASIRQFTPNQILEKIRANLDFLSTNLRDVPERHRSVRAVFEHSWNLLTEEERNILSGLSVFRGGFTEDAACQILQAEAKTLFVLSEKSLLQRNSHGRFDLHELIRQFAGEKISGRDAILERHSQYYLHWMAQHEQLLRIADQTTLQVAAQQMGNVRLAWDWACIHQCTDWLAEASEALMQFYDARSLFVESEDAFREALDVLEKAGVGQTGANPAERRAYARILGYVGWAANRLGKLDEARQQVETAYHIFQEELSDPSLLRTWQRRLGYVCWLQAEHKLAESLSQAALTSARKEEARLDMLDCLSNLVLIANQSGEHARAIQFGTEQAEIAREVSPHSLIFALNNLGLAYYYLGEYSEARVRFVEAIDLSRKVENRHSLALAINNLGIIEKADDNLGKAIDCFQQALVTQKEIGNRLGIASNLSNLGSTFNAQGNYVQAQEYQLQALAILREISHRWGIALVLNALADNSISLRDMDAAKKFLAEGLTLALEIDVVPIALNGLLHAARLLREQKDTARAVELVAYVQSFPELDSEIIEMASALWEQMLNSLPADKVETICQNAMQKAWQKDSLKETAENVLQTL